jgi:molybdopterin-guanine dinucleotide biosynthesis protein A
VIGLAGIFVGGASRRMGGEPKGLLRAHGGATVVERSCSLLRAVGLPVVLVGDARAYEHLGLPVLADDPPGVGPLGGLVALLRRANPEPAVALACDMPFVSRALVERLLAAPAEAPVIAPKRESRWEPLCARYDPVRVLPLALAQAASQHHSLQRLLDAVHAWALPLSEAERDHLRDWDEPGDIEAQFRPRRS